LVEGLERPVDSLDAPSFQAARRRIIDEEPVSVGGDTSPASRMSQL